MSANNWDKCPQCEKNRQDEIIKLDEAAASNYGVVSSEKYLAMLKNLRELEDKELGDTLREDYSVWIDEEGTFSVSYRCFCKVCGFEHIYKYFQKLELK